jgi:hypothetical protein
MATNSAKALFTLLSLMLQQLMIVRMDGKQLSSLLLSLAKYKYTIRVRGLKVISKAVFIAVIQVIVYSSKNSFLGVDNQEKEV